jgi:hypothetical protein
MMSIDARLPVRFAPIEERTPDEAVLTDRLAAGVPPFARFSVRAGHQPDCLCCAPRSGAALALATLFRERAVGPGRPFRGVLAVVGPEGEAAVRAALVEDPLAAGRFRLT